ncbi:hypothetical protein [Chryseobacterium sp. BIGb0232]|uniref:hypothetical protein n=1 Tax=Chryseobacterium sp. BIGb0232 TaxID=2940598 RepID=UPI000F49E4D3|nr:hypothetical protein [Chryseobacterium sp. BIGb0232]MCS4301215.1 hypothetical protein [Chryseobacterium sp. BIGb0232]ROS19924.1 hypothetical protein EDF65_0622 [Chryseobacterium nakagawai]
MMKIFPFILLFLLVCACSPKVTRLAVPEDKADFGISNPSKALFFVENESIIASEEHISNHKAVADHLYRQFGGATERVMVGRTNAKAFKFSNGATTWFVNVQDFPKRTAMILFDGKNEPIIEYNTKNYERLVKKYLSEDLKKRSETDKQNQAAEKKVSNVWNSIDAVSFTPDQKYADRIINHSNTTYYPLTSFEDSGNCNGRFINIIYLDEKQQKISYTTNITYRNGRVLENVYLRDGIESIQKHYLNKVGLLDSIVNSENGKREMKLTFKYLPDQFIIHSSWGTREEFHLNGKGQVEVQYNFNKKDKITKETYYTYDNLGRILVEDCIYDGENPVTNTYQYDSDTKRMYSKLTIKGKEGKTISENTSQIIDGKQVFTVIADGKIVNKSVSTLNSNCEGKVTTYDSRGKVVSVSAQKRR